MKKLGLSLGLVLLITISCKKEECSNLQRDKEAVEERIDQLTYSYNIGELTEEEYAAKMKMKQQKINGIEKREQREKCYKYK